MRVKVRHIVLGLGLGFSFELGFASILACIAHICLRSPSVWSPPLTKTAADTFTKNTNTDNNNDNNIIIKQLFKLPHIILSM